MAGTYKLTSSYKCILSQRFHVCLSDFQHPVPWFLLSPGILRLVVSGLNEVYKSDESVSLG